MIEAKQPQIRVNLPLSSWTDYGHEVPITKRSEYSFSKSGRRWDMFYRGGLTDFSIILDSRDGLYYSLDVDDEPLGPPAAKTLLSAKMVCMKTHYTNCVVPTLEEIGSER